MQNRNMGSIFNAIASVLLAGFIVICFSADVYAGEFISDNCYCYSDDSGESSYQTLIDDKAGLFTEDEIDSISDIMFYKAMPYGNMVLLTTDDAMGMSASDYQWNAYREAYGTDVNGVVFLIDLDNRKLWIQGYGELADVIDIDAANTITDNIYTMASDGDYAECAKEAFSQIVSALGGDKVTGPLKYIGNACIAVVISLVITFFFAYARSVSTRADDKEIINNIVRKTKLTNPRAKFIKETRTYSPQKSGSSSGGGGGSSGGGGGGGGHGF